MAEFLPAFEKMIRREGGYTLHNVPGDRGGMTYAGIAYNKHPNWPGWKAIKRGTIPESELVRKFYFENFWKLIRGDEIADQAIAESIFDFSVNAGVRTASILAQVVVGTTPDGAIGPKTLEALNSADSKLFCARYALAKIARYVEIVKRDKSQQKFLLGWVSRALEDVI